MTDLKNIAAETLEEKKRRTRRQKRKPYSSATYTNGSIGLNIDRFNTAMGTFAPSTDGDSSIGDGCDTCGGGRDGCCESLTEAKRYVRRYYIRPQNIFCSNKAEIIKTLIELDDNNCSVYTLNNLGDEKDVSKLMSSDIIYYYDNGILYDKNHVKVMDYDLSIKHEEERKHFANVDKASEKEFKNAYEDRMTDATELEESIAAQPQFSIEMLNNALETGEEIFVGGHHDSSISIVSDGTSSSPYSETLVYAVKEDNGTYTVSEWYEGADGELYEGESYNDYKTIQELYDDLAGTQYVDYLRGSCGEAPFWLDGTHATHNEAFNLDFDDYNVFGEKLTEATDDICCICGETLIGYGNNPEPYAHDGRCCDGCNLKFVIPARLRYER